MYDRRKLKVSMIDCGWYFMGVRCWLSLGGKVRVLWGSGDDGKKDSNVIYCLGMIMIWNVL